MLSRIKMGLPDIRKALLDLDDSKLSFDELKAISKHLPTVEEVQPSVCSPSELPLYLLYLQIGRIKDFQDVSKLAKADQYFNQVSIPFLLMQHCRTTAFQLITIPRLSQRLDSMLYRRKLELDIEEIRPELNIVRNASQELRSSKKFKQVLQVRLFSTFLSCLL